MEDVKPAVGAEEETQGGEHINIKVKSSDGNEVFFKAKKTTKLRKLMDAYCKRVGKDVNQVRFLFDGDRINADDTPASLGMEDEDEIDVMVAQTGGSNLL